MRQPTSRPISGLCHGDTDHAKDRLLRAATAETVNADLRTWRGLDRFHVRGRAKVLSVVRWSAIKCNLMRGIAAGVTG